MPQPSEPATPPPLVLTNGSALCCQGGAFASVDYALQRCTQATTARIRREIVRPSQKEELQGV